MRSQPLIYCIDVAWDRLVVLNIPPAYIDDGVHGSYGQRSQPWSLTPVSRLLPVVYAGHTGTRNLRCKISSDCYQQVAMACIQSGKNNRYRTTGGEPSHIPQITPKNEIQKQNALGTATANAVEIIIQCRWSLRQQPECRWTWPGP